MTDQESLDIKQCVELMDNQPVPREGRTIAKEVEGQIVVMEFEDYE